ncbi:MAG: GAF domain-containing protein [Myxococcaceae bacterium]|nr:GAF domain-containing protein [Myxococcaceae bacterium]
MTVSSNSPPQGDGGATKRLTFAATLAAEMGLPGVKRAAADGVRVLLDADGATVFVWDTSRKKLVFDAVSGPASAALAESELDEGEGVAGTVARDRQSILKSDTTGCTQIDRSFDEKTGFQTASLLAVPLVVVGELVGVIEAVRSQGRDPFGQEDLQLLEELAPFVAAAVQHARLHALQKRSNAELERRVAERTSQIARAKEEWERTFDAIRDPISLQDGFIIRRANLEYARRAGMRIQDIVGMKCHEVLAGRKEPCVGCPLQSSAMRAAEIPVKGHRLQASAFPMAFENKAWSAVLSYRDVTEQRNLEERLKETERLVSIGQLASGAAHEINNPLAFLMSNVVTLRDEVADTKDVIAKARSQQDADEWVDMLDDTLDGARRIADIVKHLQVLASPGVIARERALVNDMVGRAVTTVAGQGHRVVLELKSTQTIETSPLRLQQAFEHVVRNAKQAVDDDSAILVSTRDEPDEVVVRIEDKGVGIPDDVLPHVFEPFFTTRSVGKGTGLGLTATWGIVQQLGGRVTIESTAGAGTTLEIRLPLVSPSSPVATPKVGRYASRGELS